MVEEIGQGSYRDLLEAAPGNILEEVAYNKLWH